MAVLILRRPMNARKPLPYCSWLKDLGRPLVLFTTSRDCDEPEFAHVERFESFDKTGTVEIRAIELSDRFSFSGVFAQSEHDLLRASELREWFGLPGQSYDSAKAYRDKCYMKTLANEGGVAVPPFAPFETPLELLRFVRSHGFPCVVKPRSGAGARGVRIINSIKDLRSSLDSCLAGRYMVEAFVSGPVFHVDGLVNNGSILFSCASRYFNSCLSFQTGESSGSILLDPTSELSQKLIQEAASVISCLPTAPHFAFHAEFILDAAQNMILCEIASRPGGSRITEVIERAFGLDLYKLWVCGSFSLPIEIPELHPWRATGVLWTPGRRGRLRSLPASVPFEWVEDYRPNSKHGQEWEAPEFSGAHIATFIVSGHDPEEVEARMRVLDDWFRQHVEWDTS